MILHKYTFFAKVSFLKNLHIHTFAIFIFLWRFLHTWPFFSRVIRYILIPVYLSIYLTPLNIIFQFTLLYITWRVLKWSFYNDSPNRNFVPTNKHFVNVPVARGGSDTYARTPRGQFKKGTRGGPGKSPVSSQCILFLFFVLY